jgi:hypothetical protein
VVPAIDSARIKASQDSVKALFAKNNKKKENTRIIIIAGLILLIVIVAIILFIVLPNLRQRAIMRDIDHNGP